jgi:hypothetical protein
VKTLFFLVEGDTEEQFIKDLIAPYFENKCYIQPIKLTTNPNIGKRGGFNKYQQLKTDAENLLRQKREKFITTFVDYFRVPKDVPNYDECRKINLIDERIKCLEDAIKADIGSDIFIPYIQKHEFEALLFSSNQGFEYCFEPREAKETAKIITLYPNPEEINDHPHTAPSKRLENIRPKYSKPLEGNIIALEIGLPVVLEKCPRFKNWIENLIELVQE